MNFGCLGLLSSLFFILDILILIPVCWLDYMLLFPFVFCYASSTYPEILLAVADFIHKEPLNYLTRPQIIYEPQFPPFSPCEWKTRFQPVSTNCLQVRNRKLLRYIYGYVSGKLEQYSCNDWLVPTSNVLRVTCLCHGYVLWRHPLPSWSLASNQDQYQWLLCILIFRIWMPNKLASLLLLWMVILRMLFN